MFSGASLKVYLDMMHNHRDKTVIILIALEKPDFVKILNKLTLINNLTTLKQKITMSQFESKIKM